MPTCSLQQPKWRQLRLKLRLQLRLLQQKLLVSRRHRHYRC